MGLFGRPAGRNFPINSIAIVVILAAVAGGLLWVKDDAREFAVFLFALVVINVIAWLHLLSRVLPVIKQSATKYRDANYYLGHERLLVVAYYINGRWQWIRFLGMAVISITLLVVSFQNDLRQSAAVWIETAFALKPATISPLLPDLLFAAFVIFAEGWIWIERALTRINIRMIDTLDDYYELAPAATKSKALEAHCKVPDNLAWWKTIRRTMKPSKA